MKTAPLALALVGAASAADRSGYDMLITLFKKLHGEADGEFKQHTGTLKNKMKQCAEDAETIDGKVTDATDRKNEYSQKESETFEALEGAKADLADEEAAEKRSRDGKAGLEADYAKQKARMEFDYGKLTGATGGVDAAMTAIDGDDKMSANTKSKLKFTMTQLRQKMDADAKKLQKEMDNGVTFFEENKSIIQKQIDASVKMVKELNGKITTLTGVYDQAKQDKVTAASDLNAALKEQRDNNNDCAAAKASEEASIKDAQGRIEALASALSILGDTSAHKEDLIQQGMALMAKDGQSFLQFKEVYEKNKKPLLDLIAKFGKRSQASALLKVAVHASPKQVEAFQKIRGEITKLLNTMHQQQLTDDKDKTWCDDKKNELELQIETYTGEHKELVLALDAVNAQVEDHKNEISDARDNINQVRKDSVKRHQEIVDDLKANQKENEELDLDLTKLNQARVTLEKTFKSRSESSGEIVLEEVDKVVKDYEGAIVTNEQEKRSLETEQSTSQKQFATKLKNEKNSEKRNTLLFEEKSAKSVKTDDARRGKNTQLATAQKTFDSIFEDKEGKCKNYVDVFASRKELRTKEVDNLNAATEALQAYMESIGIRM